MMDVMVICVVGTEHLKGIEREIVPAVVVDRLERAERKQKHGLSDCHPGKVLCQGSANRVQYEAFKGMVVESTIRVGDVESVVDGM